MSKKTQNSTQKPTSTFVLDGVRYEIDSLPEKGKQVLQLIADIRAKTELEIQTSELAIDRLTAELSSMTGEFVVVPDEVKGE